MDLFQRIIPYDFELSSSCALESCGFVAPTAGIDDEVAYSELHLNVSPVALGL